VLRHLSDADWAAEMAEQAQAAANAPGLGEGERTYAVSLSGRLRYPNDLPAAYLPILIGQRRTVTDANGLYYFVDLPPGDDPLIAEVPGHGDVEIPTREGSGVVPLPEEMMPAEGGRRVALSGRLRYPSGLPAAYLSVRMGPQRTRTDANGQYFFVERPPDDLPLIAEVPGRGDVEIPVHAGSGVDTLPNDDAVKEE
jgi:hypothetical protein